MEEYKRMRLEDLGEFIAYKNKTAKCTFDDRTIIRIKLGADTAVVLTRQGERLVIPVHNAREHEKYVKVCLEFMDYVFTPPRERERREQEKMFQDARIATELSKIERTLGIMQNRVPQSSAPDMSLRADISEEGEREVCDPQVNEALQ